MFLNNFQLLLQVLTSIWGFSFLECSTSKKSRPSKQGTNRETTRPHSDMPLSSLSSVVLVSIWQGIICWHLGGCWDKNELNYPDSEWGISALQRAVDESWLGPKSWHLHFLKLFITGLDKSGLLCAATFWTTMISAPLNRPCRRKMERIVTESPVVMMSLGSVMKFN